MSLTSMLSKRGLPLREFFESRLPNLKEMQAAWRSCGQPTIIPSDPVAWSLVGAALDYRVRYFFVDTPPEEFVAAVGSRYLGGSSYENLSAGLSTFVSTYPPMGTLLRPAEEAMLARYCYLLAMYETLARAVIAQSPLFTLSRDASTDAQLQIVPETDVDDLVALSTAAADALVPFFGKPTIANPTFEGSISVGGADADLVIDGLLMEIKTTKNRSLDKQIAYQLMGYLLLDYRDACGIEELGLYLSRVPALIRWPANDLIATVSEGKETVTTLREGLQELLPSREEILNQIRVARANERSEPPSG